MAEVLLSLGLRRDSISFGGMVSCAAWPAALQGLQGMQQVRGDPHGAPWGTLPWGYPNSWMGWMVNGTSYENGGLGVPPFMEPPIIVLQ